MAKLLLADDHVLFKEALLLYIKTKRPEWQVVTAPDLPKTLALLQQQDGSFDLVLLDMRMPGMHGLYGLQTLLKEIPDQNVAILSGMIEEPKIKEAIKMGAKAYFPKTLSSKTLIHAIEDVITTGKGYVPMDETGAHLMPAYYDDSDNSLIREEIKNSLTRREKHVLHYLTQGLANKDIARKLNLQPTTVKIHVGNICRKLDVTNRTQAAILCHQYDITNILERPS